MNNVKMKVPWFSYFYLIDRSISCNMVPALPSCMMQVFPDQDKSWRVRYMVANQLYELCEAVGPEPTR